MPKTNGEYKLVIHSTFLRLKLHQIHTFIVSNFLVTIHVILNDMHEFTSEYYAFWYIYKICLLFSK